MRSAKIPGEEGPRPDIGPQGPLNPHGSAFTKQLKWLHCLRGFQDLDHALPWPQMAPGRVEGAPWQEGQQDICPAICRATAPKPEPCSQMCQSFGLLFSPCCLIIWITILMVDIQGQSWAPAPDVHTHWESRLEFRKDFQLSLALISKQSVCPWDKLAHIPPAHHFSMHCHSTCWPPAADREKQGQRGQASIWLLTDVTQSRPLPQTPAVLCPEATLNFLTVLYFHRLSKDRNKFGHNWLHFFKKG